MLWRLCVVELVMCHPHCNSEVLSCVCSYGHLSAAAAEEQRRAVTLPLDEYLASEQPAAKGEKTKRKARPRKVNAIYAFALEKALKYK